MRELNSENVASSARVKPPLLSDIRISNSEPPDCRAKSALTNLHSLLTSSRFGRRTGIPARGLRAMPGHHLEVSTRHSQTSRIARNPLKTNDSAPVYPRQFPSSNSLPRLIKFRVCGTRGATAVDEQTIAKRYFVSGIVQGVGFRYFSQGGAVKLGVAGYARNLFDGRVEVYAVGTERQLKALRALLERGPRMASVSGVTEEDAAVTPQFSSGFSIEYDA